MDSVRAGPRLVVSAVLLGLLLSQPGHALGYVVVYGVGGLAVESQGAHWYFPMALHLSVQVLATAGAAVAGTLGLGRLAAGRALGFQSGPRARPIELIVVMAVVQVNVFVFQELVEATAVHAGTDLQWLLRTLLAAVAGQVPVAVLGGVVLAWCGVRLRAAVQGLSGAIALARHLPVAPIVVSAALTPRAGAQWLDAAFPRAFRKRGPPRASTRFAF